MSRPKVVISMHTGELQWIGADTEDIDFLLLDEHTPDYDEDDDHYVCIQWPGQEEKKYWACFGGPDEVNPELVESAFTQAENQQFERMEK